MRIVQYITPSRIGGAETHLLTVVRLLRDRGHDVITICPRGRPLTEELARQSIPLIAPRTCGKLDPIMVCRLARLLKRAETQVLHTHLSTASLLGSLAGRLAGVPVVSTVHGMNHKTCFTLSPGVIAISQAVKDHLVKQGLPAERISLVRHGINADPVVEQRTAAAVRMNLRLPASVPIIGSVGRLSREKGHRFLIEAVSLLSQMQDVGLFHVIIVGDGVERRALERLASSSLVSPLVTFAGFQRDVLSYMSVMDLLVVPSLKEALSLAAMEAMSLGKSVVASRVGGTPEVVAEGETGVLVEPGCPRALADAVAALLRDPARRDAMGKAGKRRVEQCFSQETMVSRIEGLYTDLVLAQQSKGRPV